MLRLPLSEGGWLEEANYNTDPTGTRKGGISIAGTCQGPKDIPDSVAQGSAAAARTIQSLLKAKVSLDSDTVFLEEIEKRIKETALINS